MLAAELNLIQRLKERNSDRQRATDGHLHPARPIPPTTNRKLEIAERAIGFQLPELLRAIYLQVGNGGFGPEYGIVGTKGGFKLDNCSLESCYQGLLQLEKENSVWRWPGRLLPLANYGCGMWSCVDCEYKKLPMILWDPNIHSRLRTVSFSIRNLFAGRLGSESITRKPKLCLVRLYRTPGLPKPTMKSMKCPPRIPRIGYDQDSSSFFSSAGSSPSSGGTPSSSSSSSTSTGSTTTFGCMTLANA